MTDKKETNWNKAILFLLGGLALLRILLMFVPEISPQGAYYWNYSRHLALGYFDHPPMTAYTIRLFCSLFGDNIFGVRFVALFYSTGYLYIMYLLGRRMFNAKVGFYSALAMALTPLSLIGGTFVTVDPAMIFFWVVSIYFFHKAVTDKKPLDFWLTGFFSGIAMLSKYPAGFLFIGYFIYLILTKEGRGMLKTPHPYIAIVISLIAFSPQIIWNAQNEWASFAFQGSRRANEVKSLRLDLFAGYVLSQLLVATPLFYVGIWKDGVGTIKEALKGNKEILFLSSFSLPTMFFFSSIGLFYWIKLNWLAPAYLTAIMLFVMLALKSGKLTRYAKVSFISSGVLTFGIYLFLLFPKVPLSGEMMTVAGWQELADTVYKEQQKLPNPENSFVFAWRYKVPSILAFYLPGQPETYSGDVIGRRTLQYHFWFDKEKLRGRDAIFVYDDRWKLKNLALLEENFERVEKAFELTSEQGGKKISTAHVYRCYGYRPAKELQR